MPTISKSRDFRGLVPAAVVRKSETGGSAQRFVEEIFEREFILSCMYMVVDLSNYVYHLK